MEENNLEDFLNTENAPNNFNAQTANSQQSRPKLRKIKRARVKITSHLPTPPEKLIPEHNDIISDNNLSISREQDVQNSTQNIPSDNSEINSTQHIESKDLATIRDINELTTSNNEDDSSPYVIGALPPDFESSDDFEEEYANDTAYVKKSLAAIIALVCFFLGIFFGKSFFAVEKIEKHGLEEVVLNPDVPAGRPRCGRTDKNQACVFYIMNWYRQELNGRDFYKLAAQLTGREEYMIETDNLLYANIKIKPGHIAQLNIPSLK